MHAHRSPPSAILLIVAAVNLLPLILIAAQNDSTTTTTTSTASLAEVCEKWSNVSQASFLQGMGIHLYVADVALNLVRVPLKTGFVLSGAGNQTTAHLNVEGGSAQLFSLQALMPDGLSQEALKQISYTLSFFFVPGISGEGGAGATLFPSDSVAFFVKAPEPSTSTFLTVAPLAEPFTEKATFNPATHEPYVMLSSEGERGPLAFFPQHRMGFVALRADHGPMPLAEGGGSSWQLGGALGALPPDQVLGGFYQAEGNRSVLLCLDRHVRIFAGHSLEVAVPYKDFFRCKGEEPAFTGLRFLYILGFLGVLLALLYLLCCCFCVLCCGSGKLKKKGGTSVSESGKSKSKMAGKTASSGRTATSSSDNATTTTTASKALSGTGAGAKSSSTSGKKSSVKQPSGTAAK
ncbi:hypothetical protein TYRP_017423 [Tyrophagus putrescentiae]|nr:hypothetical protein TYRP_017423 [Tyrophagus putrescentiae]